MSIEGINRLGLAKYAEIQRISGAGQPKGPGAAEATEGAAPVSFSQILGNSLKEVNQLQQQADGKIQDLVMRRDETSTHEAMIALEQADTAFQLMNNIRAKIVRAYEEVMRTQV